MSEASVQVSRDKRRIVCLVWTDESGTMSVIDGENVSYVLDRLAVLNNMDLGDVLSELIENQSETDEA